MPPAATLLQCGIWLELGLLGALNDVMMCLLSPEHTGVDVAKALRGTYLLAHDEFF